MKKILPVYDRASLLAIPVPPETESYTPLPVKLIFDTIDSLSNELGLTITKEEFLLHGNGNKQRLRFFFGVPNSDFTRELVLISSYDKSIALRASSGVSVVACSNGTLIGDIKIYRKHTGTVDEELKEFLRDCLVDMQEIYQYAEETRDKYKNVILTPEQIGIVLGRCFFEFEYLSSSQLNIVKEQFKRPKYDYEADPMSLWSFYQHLTYALQNESAVDYLENRRGIQEVIADFYSSTLPFTEYTEVYDTEDEK